MAKKLPKTIAEKYIEGLRRRWPGLASAEAQDALPYRQIEDSGADMPSFYYFLAVGTMSQSGVSADETSRRLQNPESGEVVCKPFDVELDMLWAKSRHVFRCDETLADELAQEGLPGKMPVEILRMLPYPVMFVEAPVCLETDTGARIEAKGSLDAACLAHAINLVLYINSENADTETIYVPTGLTQKKASQAEIVAVGTHVGPALGEDRIAYVAQDDDSNLTSKKKAPHIRRGHLHCYVGRHKDGTRTYTVKRQPPMNVGFGGVGETVVHEAKCSSACSR